MGATIFQRMLKALLFLEEATNVWPIHSFHDTHTSHCSVPETSETHHTTGGLCIHTSKLCLQDLSKLQADLFLSLLQHSLTHHGYLGR